MSSSVSQPSRWRAPTRDELLFVVNISHAINPSSRRPAIKLRENRQQSCFELRFRWPLCLHPASGLTTLTAARRFLAARPLLPARPVCAAPLPLRAPWATWPSFATSVPPRSSARRRGAGLAPPRAPWPAPFAPRVAGPSRPGGPRRSPRLRRASRFRFLGPGPGARSGLLTLPLCSWPGALARAVACRRAPGARLPTPRYGSRPRPLRSRRARHRRPRPAAPRAVSAFCWCSSRRRSWLPRCTCLAGVRDRRVAWRAGFRGSVRVDRAGRFAAAAALSCRRCSSWLRSARGWWCRPRQISWGSVSGSDALWPLRRFCWPGVRALLGGSPRPRRGVDAAGRVLACPPAAGGLASGAPGVSASAGWRRCGAAIGSALLFAPTLVYQRASPA